MLVGGVYGSAGAVFGQGEPNETSLSGSVTGNRDLVFFKYTPANYRYLQVTRTP